MTFTLAKLRQLGKVQCFFTSSWRPNSQDASLYQTFSTKWPFRIRFLQ